MSLTAHIGLLLPIYVIIPALFNDFNTAVAQLLDVISYEVSEIFLNALEIILSWLFLVFILYATSYA